ncbi:hypothetical protein CRG98_023214 [Punica granatum]|nr:hypothetical protein CRG98_023214 [Punica granatum]
MASSGVHKNEGEEMDPSSKGTGATHETHDEKHLIKAVAEKIFSKNNEGPRTERYRSDLAKVRAELQPWEKQLIEHKGKLEVACTESKFLSEKHEAGRAAFEDARKQMDDITGKIAERSDSIANIRGEIERTKHEAFEARKLEEECIREQEAQISHEQAAREKLAELKSVMDSKKSQGSVLKAILQAKQSNQIGGNQWATERNFISWTQFYL